MPCSKILLQRGFREPRWWHAQRAACHHSNWTACVRVSQCCVSQRTWSLRGWREEWIIHLGLTRETQRLILHCKSGCDWPDVYCCDSLSESWKPLCWLCVGGEQIEPRKTFWAFIYRQLNISQPKMFALQQQRLLHQYRCVYVGCRVSISYSYPFHARAVLIVLWESHALITQPPPTPSNFCYWVKTGGSSRSAGLLNR